MHQKKSSNQETIYESASTIVTRVTTDDGSLIIKRLKSNRYARLRREFKLATKVQSDRVVRPLRLEESADTVALIFEDFDGRALSEIIQTSQIFRSVEAFLKIAIPIARGIQDIHRHGIIHQDIKPANIIVNLETDEVRITDFGIALQRVSGYGHQPSVALRVRGTLAYVAPEQTGRMNRAVDHRADLYSLGITLYEILTGRTPFPDSNDPLEMIHRHIAVRPPDPAVVDETIPRALADIILKLLAKDAEDRYQTAVSVVADLEECVRRVESGGTLTDFVPGRRDVSDQFSVSQKLFGREKPSARIADAWRRVISGGSEIIFVNGFAGVGKSSVVLEIQRLILERRSFFLTGKFDQYQVGIPYSGFLAAFRQLVAALLKEDPERVAALSTRLRQAVGPNGRIIIEVVPEMERILGAQPSLTPVPPEDAEHRFNGVFRELIRVLADVEHPLFIFLDDLHWADAASLRLIGALMTDLEIRHLMIVGAYRDNEIDEDHILRHVIAELREAKIEPVYVPITPLESGDVNQILAATLHAPSMEIQELAEYAHQKTGGNPFFLREFLQSLHRDKSIAYDEQLGRWRYDTRAIRALPAPEHIAGLMASRIELLTADSRRVLAVAACAGNRFDLALLAPALERVAEDVADLLEPALRAGLISWREPEDGGDEASMSEIFDAKSADTEIRAREVGSYFFQHDKIQQAAYVALSAREGEEIHADLARIIIAQNESKNEMEPPPRLSDRLDERIFAIVHHIQRAGATWFQHANRVDTASLFLRAGERALASTASQAAAGYFTAGIECLGDDGWSNQYELCLAMCEKHAMAEFLSANLEKADAIVETIFLRARAPADRIAACEIRMAILSARGQFAQVVDIGLEALALVGIRLPRNPGPIRSMLGFLKTETYINFCGADSISRARPNDDPLVITRMRLLMTLLASSYRSNRYLFLLISSKSVQLAYRSGITASTPLTLVAHGMVLSSFGRHRRAAKFGEHALDLMKDRCPRQANTLFSYESMIAHWTMSLEKSCSYLREGAQVGLQTGEVEYQGYNRLYLSVHRMYATGDLIEVETDLNEQYQLARRQRNGNWLSLVTIYLQMTQNLRAADSKFRGLSGEVYTEEAALVELHKTEAWGVICMQGIAAALMQYLFHRNADALESIRLARKFDAFVSGMYFSPLSQYLEGLICLRLARDATSANRKKDLLRAADKIIRAFRRFEKNNPVTYRHKTRLLQAERARLLGRHKLAADFYNAALQEASANQYLLDEALVCELAGDYFHSRDQDRVARNYIVDARAAYTRWGAAAKARDVEERYGALMPAGDATISNARRTLESTLAATRADFGDLDLDTLSRAARVFFAQKNSAAIQSEFLTLAMENAGARRGLLILRRKDRFWIEELIDFQNQEKPEALPYENYDEIARGVVNLAIRDRKPVILEDAANAGEFIGDPYVRRRHCKSILASPIAHQGEIIGILYLENDLAVNVFAPDRLRILDVLSHQVAVSLENARIYENMKTEITEKSRELVSLKLARNRMDPHLLFNSLNMVHVLMTKEPERANQALFALGNLYRTLTEISEQDLVTFEQEWRFTLDYLELMGLRYANSLVVMIDAPAVLPDIQLPALCLQPLVENCFKHAFRLTTDKMRVRVSLMVGPTEVLIDIVDNGGGFAREELTGTTLRSIEERLRHYFPGSSITIDSPTQGARVRVRLVVS